MTRRFTGLLLLSPRPSVLLFTQSYSTMIVPLSMLVMVASDSIGTPP